ncbi:MAG: bifunctional precorrin-2 dehydrogenase/sirohydrochlorin ferrochelatase [Chloroflexi bacterium]|nr:bifunctional precorrin-2 dehydrogenase/sirohydrochlorin ferrochelatase [Chloroflexota bacterium]
MAEAASGYPILLHLQDKHVAVIGGGRVGARKVRHLLRTGARVLLVSPGASADLQDLADNGDIEWIRARYQRDMLNDYMPIIVIAATDDPRVNKTVAQDAHRIRALCNVANGSADHSDFSNMALIEQPPLTIALSSNGKSPALIRMLKRRLETDFGEEYALLAEWLGEIRQAQQQRLPTQAERQDVYQDIVTSELLVLLREGEREKARHLFEAILLGDEPE